MSAGTATRKQDAGRSPLSRRPTRQSYIAPQRYGPRGVRAMQESASTGSVLVPMLEDIAALLSADVLASVRRQVQPGERIAVYVGAGGRGRAIIVGGERRYAHVPPVIEAQWQLAGVVEVLEDGERALPLVRANAPVAA